MKVVIKITRDKTWTDQPLELEFEDAKSLYDELGKIFNKPNDVWIKSFPKFPDVYPDIFRYTQSGTTLPVEPRLHDCQNPDTISGLSCSCPKCSPIAFTAR